MSAHQPVALFAGSEDCFERECEEYLTEDGENDPGVERCSHIAEQTVCGGCSVEGPDGDFRVVIAWPCGQAASDGD